MKRKIKLVTIDGDGCLFAYTNIGSAFHSSWDALAFAYGLKEVWDERGKKYYRSAADSGQWAEEDAADMRGRSLQPAEAVLFPIPYSPGVTEFLRASRGKLLRGLLSACIGLVGKKAADETGLDFCFCNTLHTRDGVFTGTLDYAVSTWHKHLLLPEICRRHGVRPEEICHVGDHENDIPCFERVGLAVAYRPKTPEVARTANHSIDDFGELGRILGLA
ncbi:MAG: haloacid dehalogenase-like hydrolase [Verrucomicrobiota bacterium]|jgi:phosphoserine phosphatase